MKSEKAEILIQYETSHMSSDDGCAFIAYEAACAIHVRFRHQVPHPEMSKIVVNGIDVTDCKPSRAPKSTPLTAEERACNYFTTYKEKMK